MSSWIKNIFINSWNYGKNKFFTLTSNIFTNIVNNICSNFLIHDRDIIFNISDNIYSFILDSAKFKDFSYNFNNLIIKNSDTSISNLVFSIKWKTMKNNKFKISIDSIDTTINIENDSKIFESNIYFDTFIKPESKNSIDDVVNDIKSTIINYFNKFIINISKIVIKLSDFIDIKLFNIKIDYNSVFIEKIILNENGLSSILLYDLIFSDNLLQIDCCNIMSSILDGSISDGSIKNIIDKFTIESPSHTENNYQLVIKIKKLNIDDIVIENTNLSISSSKISVDNLSSIYVNNIFQILPSNLGHILEYDSINNIVNNKNNIILHIIDTELFINWININQKKFQKNTNNTSNSIINNLNCTVNIDGLSIEIYICEINNINLELLINKIIIVCKNIDTKININKMEKNINNINIIDFCIKRLSDNFNILNNPVIKIYDNCKVECNNMVVTNLMFLISITKKIFDLLHYNNEIDFESTIMDFNDGSFCDTVNLTIDKYYEIIVMNSKFMIELNNNLFDFYVTKSNIIVKSTTDILENIYLYDTQININYNNNVIFDTLIREINHFLFNIEYLKFYLDSETINIFFTLFNDIINNNEIKSVSTNNEINIKYNFNKFLIEHYEPLNKNYNNIKNNNNTIYCDYKHKKKNNVKIKIDIITADIYDCKKNILRFILKKIAIKKSIENKIIDNNLDFIFFNKIKRSESIEYFYISIDYCVIVDVLNINSKWRNFAKFSSHNAVNMHINKDGNMINISLNILPIVVNIREETTNIISKFINSLSISINNTENDLFIEKISISNIIIYFNYDPLINNTLKLLTVNQYKINLSSIELNHLKNFSILFDILGNRYINECGIDNIWNIIPYTKIFEPCRILLSKIFTSTNIFIKNI